MTEPDAQFAQGVEALNKQNATDAINAFEALADQGFVDASASFDRGLAYALRVRLGGEVPGDLGRAAHGFEEARDLAPDSETKDASTRALAIVRGEIARRRVRQGEPAIVEQSPRPHVAIARALAEDTWAILAIVSACAIAIALVVRARNKGRIRVGATVALALSTLLLASSMGAAALRRHERRTLEEAVIVVPTARPQDASGIVKQGATPIAEGARVEILEWHAGLAHVRWGSEDAWLPASSVRSITMVTRDTR